MSCIDSSSRCSAPTATRTWPLGLAQAFQAFVAAESETRRYLERGEVNESASRAQDDAFEMLERVNAEVDRWLDERP